MRKKPSLLLVVILALSTSGLLFTFFISNIYSYYRFDTTDYYFLENYQLDSSTIKSLQRKILKEGENVVIASSKEDQIAYLYDPELYVFKRSIILGRSFTKNEYRNGHVLLKGVGNVINEKALLDDNQYKVNNKNYEAVGYYLRDNFLGEKFIYEFVLPFTEIKENKSYDIFILEAEEKQRETIASVFHSEDLKYSYEEVEKQGLLGFLNRHYNPVLIQSVVLSSLSLIILFICLYAVYYFIHRDSLKIRTYYQSYFSLLFEEVKSLLEQKVIIIYLLGYVLISLLLNLQYGVYFSFLLMFEMLLIISVGFTFPYLVVKKNDL